MSRKQPLLVGIDPAFRKSGFCVCIVDQEKEVRFITFRNGFLDFLVWLRDLPPGVLFCIENSNLQNVTFETPREKKMAIAARLKKSRNVGANQAISQCTVDICRNIFGKKKVIEVSPRTKGVKWKETAFSRVVKSEGHTMLNYTGSQDQRDAYKLALMARQFRYRVGVF